MNRSIINFDQKTLGTIHQHSLDLLSDTGIRMPSKQALALFEHHGFKTDGEIVFFDEKSIEHAIQNAPAAFTIDARHPEKTIRIGGDNYAIAPGYGPPMIIESTGEKRNAALQDAHNFCKLVHTSKVIDFNSSIVVQPCDVPAERAYLDLLFATLTLTDKAIMGSSASGIAAADTVRMAEIVWGTLNRPVMISLINSLSPLQYASEMIDALMVYAAAGQPVIVHSACSLGTTGPITIAGSLVVSNATTLAGICLTQLINPGTPVVYGLGGSPTDMRTGGYVNASPEDVKHIAISSAMGRYYQLPSRGQGALTEAFCLDYQAGMESAMMLTTAALSGIHVGIHACGTYGSMLAMSFEKFIADEELCGAIKKLIKPVEFSDDAFSLDLIREVGVTGNYLVQPQTLERCRDEFFIPELNIRTLNHEWLEMADKDISQRAKQLIEKRLKDYEKPEIDPAIEQSLAEFITERSLNF